MEKDKTFSQALEVVKSGGRIRRAAWKTDTWFVIGDEKYDPTPHLRIHGTSGSPFLLTQEDIMSEDWEIE